MKKKKFFGLLTSAAMLLNAAPLSVLAEEMVEASGVVSGAVTDDNGSILINDKNFPDENFLKAIQNQANGNTDAADITTLNIPSSVENLAGLEYLTGLQYLTLNDPEKFIPHSPSKEECGMNFSGRKEKGSYGFY